MRSSMSLSYSEALDYIYSFTNYEVKPEYRYAPDVIDPTRPKRLLALLGDPQDAYPSIHIAGTKGKGSVAAICASALRAVGLRTGLYTSPHLQSFGERIQIDGYMIPDDELAALVDEIRPVVDEIDGITTFEVITALAFLYFARQQVDIAVVEVGLGGRLDATNVVEPVVSVITSLSLDHTHLLGETLPEIAGEKGGIIKPGVPVVTAWQPSEALAVLHAIADERGAPLTTIGQDWWYELDEVTLDGQTFRAGKRGEPGHSYTLPLIGEHQVLNGTVALAALDIVRERRPGLGLESENIRQGLALVRWPGRFQVVGRRPVVVLDGAHNVDSAFKLRRTLERVFPDQCRILVLGVTAEKDVGGIIRALAPVADEIIVTAANHPRAATAADLGRQVQEAGFWCAVSSSVADGLGMALAMAGPSDVICVTGSLFVVGDALTAWRRQEIGERADVSLPV
jgi:dihydrofolate synthase/folylpolyglutamate synthase